MKLFMDVLTATILTLLAVGGLKHAYTMYGLIERVEYLESLHCESDPDGLGESDLCVERRRLFKR